MDAITFTDVAHLNILKEEFSRHAVDGHITKDKFVTVSIPLFVAFMGFPNIT